MKFSKRIVHSNAITGLVCWLLAGYIRFVYFTSRRVQFIDPKALRYIHGEDNATFAFWHGRMMMMPAICPPHHQMRVLISHHRDGAMISRVIAHFHQATISGSTSRGAEAAVREILRALEAGDNISITPDGPRGPAQVAAKGFTAIARLSGKPIIPVTFSASRFRTWRSWDRFMVALPFGRIVFCMGAPIVLERRMDETQEEAARKQMEQAMNDLIDTADRMIAGTTHA